VSTSSGTAVSSGELGGFFCDLADGPKAFDAAGRRAFYMLSSGEFNEMDIVAVDVDSIPPKVLESPALCGVIFNCPSAFAYSPF